MLSGYYVLSIYNNNRPVLRVHTLQAALCSFCTITRRGRYFYYPSFVLMRKLRHREMRMLVAEHIHQLRPSVPEPTLLTFSRWGSYLETRRGPANHRPLSLYISGSRGWLGLPAPNDLPSLCLFLRKRVGVGNSLWSDLAHPQPVSRQPVSWAAPPGEAVLPW